jgi:hypothetical protein
MRLVFALIDWRASATLGLETTCASLVFGIANAKWGPPGIEGILRLRQPPVADASLISTGGQFEVVVSRRSPVYVPERRRSALQEATQSALLALFDR